MQIADTKQLQEENKRLKKINQLFYSIFDSIDASIYAIDEDDTIILYNKSTEELENKKRSEVLGKKENDIYDDNYCKNFTKKIKESHKPLLNKMYHYTPNKTRSYYSIGDYYPFFYNNQYAGIYAIGYDLHSLHKRIHNAVNLENLILDEQKNSPFSFEKIIGNSAKIKRAISLAEQVSMRDSTVMITGETGTGKELFAKGIHNASRYRQGPFIPINCAAIPETLLESILFGVSKGSFTNAVESPGLFEQADGGTLFLDEINSMPISSQAKLLRAIQEKCVRRVGGKKEISFHCRIISATNIDLHKSYHNEFRSDLLFRLSVVNINLPSLRERKEDIPTLANYFVERNNKKYSLGIQSIDQTLLEKLCAYDWPGNIRELENYIEGAMNFVKEGEAVLCLHHLPLYYQERLESIQTQMIENNERVSTLREATKYFQKCYIRSMLERNNWNVTHTSRQLGMARQNLQTKMKEFGLKRS